MTREQFMKFFRSNRKLETLTTDDRIEIFETILPGASDITVELLNSIISDYDADNVVAIERTRLDELIETETKQKLLSEALALAIGGKL